MTRENLVAVDDDTYEERIVREPLVLLYYYADWAGPCHAQDQVIDELVADHPELTVATLDVDENDDATEAYDVTSLPAMILFEHGEPVDSFVGRTPLSVLETALESRS